MSDFEKENAIKINFFFFFPEEYSFKNICIEDWEPFLKIMSL